MSTNAQSLELDLGRLLRLRLVVARHGEMDGAGWWSTNGVLGRKGGLLMRRGFPATHSFAQARLVFAVAKARSAERFPAVPGCFTLWNLPAQVEDEFDAQWPVWIDESEHWASFFEELQPSQPSLLAMLRERGLIKPALEQEVARMRRSAEGRSVPLPGIRRLDDDTVTLLAAGFCRGDSKKPAIPYARLDG